MPRPAKTDSDREPPERDLAEVLSSAAAGQPEALAEVQDRFADWLRTARDEGLSAYGDFSLAPEELASGLARILLANIAAERSRDPASRCRAEDHLARLIAADAYLAEALVLGRAAAWTRFESILQHALRLAGRHGGGSLREIFQDLQDELLGSFFAGDKVRTYRAVAPIQAWARQVLLNQIRHRLQLRKNRAQDVALSSLVDGEGSTQGIEPAAKDPMPEELATRAEWRGALAKAIPQALRGFDRDELRMLQELPVGRITQVELARELGVSPFKINRWYREVRERFLRQLTHQMRLLIGLGGKSGDELVAYLAGCLEREGESAQS